LVAHTDSGTDGNKNIVVVIVVGIALAAIVVLGYLAWHIFFGGAGTANVQNGAKDQAASSTVVPVGTAVASSSLGAGVAPANTGSIAISFVHKTLFKTPADQTLPFVLSPGGAATTAQDLESFNQKIAALLAGVNKNARMTEISISAADGSGVAVGDVLAQANASFLSAAALADFSPDATFFAYRDQDGFWPGIVLSLAPGSNLLSAQNDVRSLESSPVLASFFLNDPGTPSAGGFANSTVSGTAVRSIAFAGTIPPSMFLYGWYQSYLIISTSRNGFAAAMSLL